VFTAGEPTNTLKGPSGRATHSMVIDGDVRFASHCWRIDLAMPPKLMRTGTSVYARFSSQTPLPSQVAPRVRSHSASREPLANFHATFSRLPQVSLYTMLRGVNTPPASQKAAAVVGNRMSTEQREHQRCTRLKEPLQMRMAAAQVNTMLGRVRAVACDLNETMATESTAEARKVQHTVDVPRHASSTPITGIMYRRKYTVSRGTLRKNGGSVTRTVKNDTHTRVDADDEVLPGLCEGIAEITA
jgi:hypothetical protein